MAKVFDLTKSTKKPQVDSFLLKAFRPDGSYTIDVGPFQIEMDAGEKQNLLEEWALLEKLFAEWRAQGKTCDYADETFLQFVTDGHNRT
jgi:hypothetical protein